MYHVWRAWGGGGRRREITADKGSDSRQEAVTGAGEVRVHPC